MCTTFPALHFQGTLRPSQQEVIALARHKLRSGHARRLHIVAPPGSGKIVVGLYIWEVSTFWRRSWLMNGVVFLTVFMLHLSAGLLNDASAQAHCDPSLTLITDNQLGYRDRGDRCEGTYIKQAGSTTLFVASFTELFEQYDAKSGKPLQIEWDTLTDNTGVRIRAQGVKQKLYYRMDTFRPSLATSYTWSTNILASLNILKKDIGVIGITRYPIGQSQRDVYLPLRIRQETNAIRTSIYNLVLLPGVELSEIYISLPLIGPDGRPQKFIRDGERLGYGYYPAERIIEIPIAGLNNAGIYYLEIGATLRSGGTSTLELWFYKAD